MGRFAWLALAFILAACGDTTSSESVSDSCDCGFYTDEAGNLLHWGDGAQIQFHFNRDFPANTRALVATAGDSYNDLLSSTNIDIQMNTNRAPDFGATPDSIAQHGINGLYSVDGAWPWKHSDSHSKAMTIVSFYKGKIVEADVFFRGEEFPTAVSQGAPISGGLSLSAKIDILSSSNISSQSVYMLALHEFGHSLGRVHTSSHNTSIMYPSVSVRFLTSPFDSFDLTTFAKVYGLSR